MVHSRSAWISLDPQQPPLAATAPLSAAAGVLPTLFHSPLLTLIEGVYRDYPETARHHLRKAISVNYAPSFAEHSLVKVAAKRVRVETPPAGFTSTPVVDGPLGNSFAAGNQVVVKTAADLRALLLMSLARESDSGVPRYRQDRPVSAALLTREGQVLATARNEGGSVRCRHAEMNLLRGLSRTHTEIPAESIIAVSLKPCRMCAAFLVSAVSLLENLRVIYLENDPGPLASGTALDASSPGRLAFLHEREQVRPQAAQEMIRHPDFSRQIQWDGSSDTEFDRRL